MRDWTDRDNNKRTSAEVVADNIYFGDSRREGGDASYGGGYQGGYQNNYAPAAPRQQDNAYPGSYTAPVGPSDFAEISEEDGDLPF